MEFGLPDAVSHGAQYPWSGSSIPYQQTPYRRTSTSPAVGDLTPYNERLDAKEWLDKLLDSLTSAEPILNGVNEQRSPFQQSPQRIFQREARPSLTFVQNHPTGKRRFSLASVRVNPTSLKRQHIFAAPNMALLELENPARIPNRFNAPNIRPTNIPRLVHQQQRPRDVQWQPVPTFRQQQPYVQTYQQQGAEGDYLGHSQLTFENPATSGSTTSERHLDVDVYVNHHP